MADEKRTVMDVFEETVARYGDRPALQWKQDGKWRRKTWSGYRDDVVAAAKSFIAMGLDPGKSVSILSFNCPQWVVSDLAAIYAGGRPAGIYATNSPEQCAYIASHAESQVIVVENHAQLAKIKEVRALLPELKAIVLMHGDDDDDDVHPWQAFLKFGSRVSDQALDARVQAQKPDDVCTYIYTSGTTGQPKAVMISHDNFTWTTRASLEMLGCHDGEVFASYLPLSHVAEQIFSLHGPMHTYGYAAFAESFEELGDNLKDIRPTMFLGVPRVWEKIQAAIVVAGGKNSRLKKWISRWARRKGLAGGYADQRGHARPSLFRLADLLVFRKVREKLGLTRSHIQITSAAPISRDTLDFFLSLGLPIMEVYGMSECTGPCTLSLPHAYKIGKVGRILPGTEVRIADDGEILMRGRHVFKGYFKNEAATAEAIDPDGWLHSGDIGKFDDDGFLQITDRKKDLIITAGGENIAPQMIEGRLRGIEGVSQAIVVGDRQKHLSALLTLDETQLQQTLAQAGSTAHTMEEAAKDERVRVWVMKQVELVNDELARVQAVRKISILSRDLTIEAGDLTPTMKVKRKAVNEKYAEKIKAFYA